MTPEAIHEIAARYDELISTFDRTRSFREYNAARKEVIGDLLAYAKSGAEHSQRAYDAYNLVASFEDAAGLVLLSEDLTLDHSPADQQAYFQRREKSFPLSDTPTDAELLGEGRRLGDQIGEWLSRYAPEGRTYREFWDAYQKEGADFGAFLKRPDLPDRARENATMVLELPIQRGFEPESHSPPHTLDELIRDPSRDA